MADGLVELCKGYADVESTGKFRFTIVAHRRVDGSADCDGLEVAPATLDALAPNARVKERVEDAHGVEVATSRARAALPAWIERHLVDRDPHCRVTGCPQHHRMLTPHGPWHLVGDPERIDGLRFLHEDDLIDARAGPSP
jgi:hypothetical protein